MEYWNSEYICCRFGSANGVILYAAVADNEDDADIDDDDKNSVK